MSTAIKNQKNKDQSRWSLVGKLVLLALAIPPLVSFAQITPAAKTKVEATVDDNSADDSGQDDTDDNTENDVDETKEVDSEAPKQQPNVTNEDSGELDIEDNPVQEAQILEATEPVVPPPVEPVAELPSAEPAAEAPPMVPEPEPYIPLSPAVENESIEALPTTAENNFVEVIPSERTVELELRKDYKKYRERRTTHGFMFNFNAENLYFQDYMSIVDQKLYEELFGQEDLTLLQVFLDYKLNFFLGSLTAGAGYGQGTLVDDRIGEERSLTIAKTSFRAQWLLDSLMKEPYFVPYAGFSYWQMDLTEDNTTLNTSASYSTGYGTALTAGVLIQLNWMDPLVAKEAYLGQGLENTYLDVFWTQYQNTDEELDPAFENDFNFGVGLRMEF